MYRRYRGLERGYHHVIVLFPSRTGDRGQRAAGLCGQDWEFQDSILVEERTASFWIWSNC